jgi:MraZ protein
MTNLIGEYECRLDPKGRVMLPADLKRQVPPEARDTFIIHRGFEECLVLYPKNVWDDLVADIKNNYDPFDEDHRQFLRYFYRGATTEELDSSNRLLIPKSLLEYAAIDKDLVMSAVLDHVEIWAKENYGQILSDKPKDISKLAKEVMGKKKNQQTGHVS